jgi:tRNA modification GTPase
MLAHRDDPIMAIATAPGRGAVGVVRISGQDLKAYSQALCQQILQPRHAHLLMLKDDQGQALDQVLALYFPAPNSYTGEDVLELQGHGGTVVMHMLMARCLSLAQSNNRDGKRWLPRLRMAQAGEFTQRAYLNQKLDLAQAEAVADLIDANTEAAVRSAGRSMQGVFSDQVQALKYALVHLRVQIEACLDFPEEDLDFIHEMQVEQQLQTLLTNTAALATHAKQGALLRDGLKLVIAGQPNAGKSSLLNALAGAELAIVTPIAGTTRDVLSQSIQIEGVPIHVLDTAGLRDHAQADEVEQIGMERAWAQIKQADIVVLLNDVARTDEVYQQQQAQLQQDIEALLPKHTRLLLVDNKCDMLTGTTRGQAVSISAQKGMGLDALRTKILQLAGWQTGAQDGVFTARARHLEALAVVLEHLQAATRLLGNPRPALDLLAEECRLAQQSLSSLTGEFSADDLLGDIFSNFCIGK